MEIFTKTEKQRDDLCHSDLLGQNVRVKEGHEQNNSILFQCCMRHFK